MKRISVKFNIPDAINCSYHHQFTQVPNELLRNPKISAKAKVIIAILLSNKIGWKSHLELLITMMKEGKDSIRAGLVELESFGYLKRVRYQDKVTKKYAGIFWAYTDEPNHFNIEEHMHILESMGLTPELEKPALANPTYKNTRILNAGGYAREKHQKNIIPPKLEWIEEFCLQRKNNVDAKSFFDFYASKGWKVGNTHMVDWHAAIRTWERNDKKDDKRKPFTKFMKPYIIDDGIQYDLGPDGKYHHCVTGEVYIP